MAYRGSARFPSDCREILLCKWLGVSYRELMETPEWFVADAATMMAKEALIHAEQQARSRRRSKH